LKSRIEERFSRAYGTGIEVGSPAAEAAGYYQTSLRDERLETE
jgi:hypothetical protein